MSERFSFPKLGYALRCMEKMSDDELERYKANAKDGEGNDTALVSEIEIGWVNTTTRAYLSSSRFFLLNIHGAKFYRV